MKQCHPDSIGRYPVSGILGHGGMATVYRALMPETGRVVALKLLNPAEPLRETLGMAKLQEIFEAEVTIMSGLSHPNIAEVLDSGLDNGRPFYAMSYFCTNLGMMMGEHYLVEEPCRRIPPDKAMVYGRQILAGLCYMHDAGVIHRDIKPFNMLVTEDDTIKICDFGLSKRKDSKTYTAPGMRIGSPYYTAPEQLNNPVNVDCRSDLFATGVMLYRMLTGELPTMKDFMLSRVNPLYDGKWDAFFARALSLRPDLRFQSAGEMATVLSHLKLHRDRMKQNNRIPTGDTLLSLRSIPLSVSGKRARDTFALDRLWQPLTPVFNHFSIKDKDTIFDQTTGLIWQKQPSDSPLDKETAIEYINVLNSLHFADITDWRLPTVNELLSLTGNEYSASNICDYSSPFPDNREWFWSCDRRSATTSWFVNTCLGYAGWQENGCRYSVRAVASSSG